MAPINDNIVNATTISGTSGSIAGTLIDATLENGPWTIEGITELAYWGAASVNDGRSVWYKITPSESIGIRFGVEGNAGFAPYAELYKETSPGAYTQVGDIGDSTSNPPISELVSVSASETLYIVVDCWNFDTTEGTFTLTWEEAVVPPNDLIANAIRVNAGDTVTGTTLDATETSDESSKPGGPAVWYKYKPPAISLTTEFNFISSDEFQNARVYVSNVGDEADNANVDLGTSIMFQNVGPGDPPDSNISPFDADDWVYIGIWPNGDGGEFSFSIKIQAPFRDNLFDMDTNINYSNPRDWWAGNNVDTTTEVGEPAHAGVGTHHSVWYYFSPQHIGTYTFSIDRVWGDLVDPVIAIYRDPFDGYGSMVEITSNADTPLPSVTFDVEEANRFEDWGIVIASREAGAEGGFIASYSVPSTEPNDDIADAIVLSGTGSLSDRSLNGAWREHDDNFSFQGNHWYKVEPTQDGSLRIDVTFKGTVSPNKFYVWKVEGTKKSDYVSYASIGNFTVNPQTKVAAIPVESGETYYIEVEGDPDNTYDISWELNTDTKLNFEPTGTGDFDTNNGVTFSAGEFVCGPTDYMEQEILPLGHLRSHDSLYFRFAIRYGDLARINSGGSVPILKLLDVDGDEVYRLSILGTDASLNMLDSIRGSTPASSSGTITGNTRLSEEFIYVELFVTQYNQENPSLFLASGQYAKKVALFINGVAYSDLNQSHILDQINKVQIGYIEEPASVPDLDLRFKDILFKSVQYDVVPDLPSGSDTLFWGTSYTNLVGTTPNVIDDPTGAGRGHVLDGTSSGANGDSYGNVLRTRSLCGGWWVYLTQLTASGVLASISGIRHGVAGVGSWGIALDCESNGRLYLRVGSSQNRFYSHRLMETGSWHHIEIEVTKTCPRYEGRWWIDGEEQVPFKDRNDIGALWAEVNDFHPTITNNVGFRGYITDQTESLKGPIGPLKSYELIPDASGTHALGTIVHYTEDDGTETFIQSTDDGVTWSPLGATDPIHQYIDEWPADNSTTTADWVGQANRDGYVEYFFEDAPGADIVRLVKSLTATHAMHIMDEDLTLNTFTDLEPHSRDTTPTGAMTPENVYQLNDSSIYSRGNPVNQMPLDPEGQAWTATNLNALIARWGYQHFVIHGPQQGNVLLASRLEVLVEDTASPSLPIFTPPAPTIEISAQQFDPFEFYPLNETFELTSCDSWKKSDKRTDPNMAGKIWFYPNFLSFLNNREDSFQLFWRITPAYDDSIPGFDGVYSNSSLQDRVFTTDSQDADGIANIIDTDVTRWGNSYDIFGEYRVYSPSLIYNPCSLGDLVDEDGNVTIEVYQTDAYGVDSPVARAIFHITKGDCCGGAIHLSRIKFRSWGDQEF